MPIHRTCGPSVPVVRRCSSTSSSTSRCASAPTATTTSGSRPRRASSSWWIRDRSWSATPISPRSTPSTSSISRHIRTASWPRSSPRACATPASGASARWRPSPSRSPSWTSVHRRVDGFGRGREDRPGRRGRDREPHPVHHRLRVRRRAHAGGHLLADAARQDDERGRASQDGRTAVHLGDDGPNDGRRLRLVRRRG